MAKRAKRHVGRLLCPLAIASFASFASTALLVSPHAHAYLAVSAPGPSKAKEPVTLGRGATFDDAALQTWTTDDGLPSIVVLSMAQTGEGLLWVGTEHGLARFDGRSMHAVLERVAVTSLVAEGRTLWVGHHDGLSRVVDGELAAGPFDAVLSQKSVKALARVDDLIVAGTHTGEVVAIAPDASVRRTWDHASGLPRASITRMAALNHALFVGTERGLGIVDTVTGAVQSLEAPLATASITGVLVRGSEALVSTFDDGLFRCELARCTPVVLEGVERGVHLGQPMALDASSLLLPSSAGLLHVVGAAVRERRSDMAGTLVTVFRDRSGTVWAGAGNDGLLGGLRAMRFRGVSVWLRGRDGRTMYEEKSGSVLLGTNAAGLFRRETDGREASVPLVLESLRSVRSIADDGQGAGAIDVAGLGGVVRVAADGTQESLTGNALPSSKIRAVRRLPDGRLMLASQAGVLAGDLAHGFSVFPGTSATWFALGLTSLPGGEWLVATSDSGLWHLPSTPSTPSTTALPRQIPMPSEVGAVGKALVRDDGRVVVPNDSGICILHASLALQSCLDGREGFLLKGHVGLVDDGRGALWLSTTGGVSRVSWQELLDTAGRGDRIREPLHTLRHFTMRDGLPSNGCNGGDGNAIRMRDGRLGFACMGGFAIIDPDLARIDEQAPTVVLEAVDIDGAMLRNPSTEPLPNSAQRVTFSFAAPSLVGDEKVQQYRVKLQGFDADWVSGDAASRRASYTNLPRGRELRFLVKATNHDGVWNEVPASYAFTIAPRWFERVVVQIGGFASFVMLLVAAYKARTAQLKGRAIHLESVVAERTNDLQNALRALDDDLEEARRFQELSMGALPSVLGLDIATRWLPAGTVGGDFFIVHEREDGVRVIVLDATGHGVQAALRTMVLKTAYDAGAARAETPGEVLTTLNDALVASYGELEAKTDALCVDIVSGDGDGPRMIVATAGSMSVALVHGARVDEVRTPGFALGVTARRRYTNVEVAFSVGMRAVLVSDGILEQPNEAGVDYDWDRFEAVCRRAPAGAAHAIDEVLASWNHYRGSAAQRDDATVLVIDNTAFDSVVGV